MNFQEWLEEYKSNNLDMFDVDNGADVFALEKIAEDAWNSSRKKIDERINNDYYKSQKV